MKRRWRRRSRPPRLRWRRRVWEAREKERVGAGAVREEGGRRRTDVEEEERGGRRTLVVGTERMKKGERYPENERVWGGDPHSADAVAAPAGAAMVPVADAF
jgi:hypothetical protein